MNSCLVVGANSDIAKALVRELAKEGYERFYLASRNEEALDLFAKDLKVRFPSVEVKTYPFDLCRLEEHESFLESLPELPYLVVVSAGYLSRNYALSSLRKEFLKNAQVNYLCPGAFLSSVAEKMAKRGEGFIVGFSSVAGDRARPSTFLYASAKAGFSELLNGLRMFLKPYGVKVLTVKPGFVRTKMTEGIKVPSFLGAEPEEVARDVAKAIKKGKGGVLYTPFYWRFIMAFIRLLPESLLSRSSL